VLIHVQVVTAVYSVLTLCSVVSPVLSLQIRSMKVYLYLKLFK